MRRKTSTRSESADSRCDLLVDGWKHVIIDFGDRWSSYSQEKSQSEAVVSSKAPPVLYRTRTKFKYK